jgi:hypothetical protein
MFGLFKPKLLIDQVEFDWLLAGIKWFYNEFGGLDKLGQTRLILPDVENFPAVNLKGHALAEYYFVRVKALAGMTDWPCDLVEGERERETRVSAGLGLKHLTKGPPLGTFGYADGRYQVSYNPSELQRPQSLIATFAHELAHYLIHTAKTNPPGGRDLEEHATDLAAVLLGFGLFMSNSSKSFEAFQNFEEQGWRARAQGYLSELSLVTALAIFVRLTRADGEVARRELKDYLRVPFARTLKALDQTYPDLTDVIARTDLEDWA